MKNSTEKVHFFIFWMYNPIHLHTNPIILNLLTSVVLEGSKLHCGSPLTSGLSSVIKYFGALFVSKLIGGS